MHFKTDRTDRTLWLLALALLAFLATSQLSLAFVRSPSADDAMFLSVPKNWLNGYGWATSYSEKIPFNPDFTGPTSLLLLTVPLIAAFGHQLWIAGVTGTLANLLLMTLCLQQFRQYWPRASLCAVALVSGCLASQPEDFASLIGYYTGSLLFLLACCTSFNPTLPLARRAILLGTLAAVGLLTKALMLPAFLLLAVAFFCWAPQRGTPRLSLLIRCGLPLLLLAGGWQLYRHVVLQAYSDEFLAARADYGHRFFLYHGSGVGQWLESPDKWQYLWRNANRNLYFVEEFLALHRLRNPFLGDSPADVNHILGLLFLLLLAMAAGRWQQQQKRSNDPITIIQLLLAITVLTYVGWFLLLAMAMSPGHLYFPMQWALWLLLLSCAKATSASRQGITAVLMVTLCLGFLMPADGQRTLLLFERDNLAKTHTQIEAAAHLQRTRWPAPLAGCGYSSYPRHIEYLLPDSQNFADCLDIVEDHVAQKADGHFYWQSMPQFVVVTSLQTAGINPASGAILKACSQRVLYRGADTLAFLCDAAAMRSINLETLMPEIHNQHNWYRTRLMPYAGKRFPVLRQ